MAEEKWLPSLATGQSEIRAVIRFLHAKGNSSTKIQNDLTSVYSKDIKSKKPAYQWYSIFETGQSSLEHAQGSCHPKSAMTEESIARIYHLIHENR